MQKNDLRKVFYEVWDRPGFDKKGYFHKFGDLYDVDSDSVLTKGIVENAETGSVEVVLPGNIRFVDVWE